MNATPSGGRAKKALLRVGISLVLVVVLVAVAGNREVLDRIRAVGLGAWSLCFLAFVPLHVVSAGKWRHFLGLTGTPLVRRTAIRCHFSGLCANLFLPSLVGGDVVRAGLAFGHAASKEGVVLASLVDRLSDVLALALLSAAGFLLAPAASLSDGARLRLDPGIVIGVAIGGVVVLVASTIFVARRVRIRRLPGKLRRVALRLARAGRSLRSRFGAVVLGVLLGIAIQGGFVVVNLLLGRAMGIDLDPRLWFLLWPLAKIAAMAPVSLGGLGFREAIFALLTAPFGVPASAAVAQSLVWQTVLMAGGVLGGVMWVAPGLRGRSRPPGAVS